MLADALEQQHVAVDQHEGAAAGVGGQVLREQEVAPEADPLELRRVAREVHVGMAESFVGGAGVGVRQHHELFLRDRGGLAAQRERAVLAVFDHDEGEGGVGHV